MKFENMTKLPDFIVIGAPKAGTTSLHEYLRQNPRIALPIYKETHFFIFDKASESVVDDFSNRILTNPINDLTDYLNAFENKPEADFFGEVCPSYLYYPNAPENIHKYVPNTKIICILRDPVDRFFSTFSYRSARNQETRSFDDIINDIKNGLLDQSIIEALEIGYYHHHLSRYYQRFPSENIKIFLFEDLMTHPEKLMDDLMEFIGLPQFPYKVSMQFNRSGYSKLDWLYKSLVRSKMIKFLRKILKANTYQRTRYLFEKLVFQKTGRISKENRTFLQQFYQPDILQLQGLINRDLSDWMG